MSNFKWRDYHISRFLDLYQAEECIWNSKSDQYKNLTMREKSYEKIRSGMGIEGLTISDIKNKIKSIRTTYKAELNKIIKAHKSDTGKEDLYEPKLFWFAQADAFLRGVTAARESQSNLIIRHTQDEDPPQQDTVNYDFEFLNVNPDEPTNFQEYQSAEASIATPSSSKSKLTSNTKRECEFTSQSLPKKKQFEGSFEQTIVDKLQDISDQCKKCTEDDEFDLFCKSLACQLKKMPLERALICQEKLQSVMTQERLQQISYKSSP